MFFFWLKLISIVLNPVPLSGAACRSDFSTFLHVAGPSQHSWPSRRPTSPGQCVFQWENHRKIIYEWDIFVECDGIIWDLVWKCVFENGIPKNPMVLSWFWLSTCLHLEACRHTRFPDFWGWTAVYHLFWCSPDAAGFGPPIWLGFDTVYLLEMILDFWPSNFIWHLGLPEKGEYIPHNFWHCNLLYYRYLNGGWFWWCPVFRQTSIWRYEHENPCASYLYNQWEKQNQWMETPEFWPVIPEGSQLIHDSLKVYEIPFLR